MRVYVWCAADTCTSLSLGGECICTGALIKNAALLPLESGGGSSHHRGSTYPRSGVHMIFIAFFNGDWSWIRHLLSYSPLVIGFYLWCDKYTLLLIVCACAVFFLLAVELPVICFWSQLGRVRAIRDILCFICAILFLFSFCMQCLFRNNSERHVPREFLLKCWSFFFFKVKCLVFWVILKNVFEAFDIVLAVIFSVTIDKRTI